MRWVTGRYGEVAPDRRPRGGRPLPGWDFAWTSQWPVGHVRTASRAASAVAVIGDCGADDRRIEYCLAAVEAHDWRALTRLPGSYLALARHGRTVAVIGDLAGQHPVHWRVAGDGIWWSTSATGLAALDGAQVDPVALAAHLALAQPDVLDTRSLFTGVRRVPTGHLLLITPDGARLARYEPVEYDPVDMRDAGPVVRAALSEAVDVRLDGRPVSADLAGLDSTTLACLAARRGPVTAVTFADARLRDDDLAYATHTAAVVPNLRHHAVPGGTDTVYYSGLHDLSALPVTDAPNADVATAGIKRAVSDVVTAHQAPGGVHFTGSAGDGVLWSGEGYLADLLRERRYGEFVRHGLGHARMRNRSLWTVLRNTRPAARTDLAGAWRHLAAELRAAPRAWARQGSRPVAWTPLLATGDWMSGEVRARLADAVTGAAERLTDAPARLAPWGDLQNVVTVAADVAGWREIAHHWHGIDLAAPYLDNEVVRACLSVPADERGAPDRYKPLLGAAFTGAGVLPDFVLARTTKGGFDSVYYSGLREHAPVLKDLLGPTSRLGALGLVTARPVLDMIERAGLGLPVATGALHLLVSAEVWLRQLDVSPASWWEEVAADVATA